MAIDPVADCLLSGVNHKRAEGFVTVAPSTTTTTAEQRLGLLIDGVKEYAIFMVDPGGAVMTWNAGAERIVGYADDEILGQSFDLLFTEEDRVAGAPERELETALRHGRCEEEGWRIRKDGSRFWAHVLLRPVSDESGELLGYAKITRDDTDRRHYEERVRRLEMIADHDRIGDDLRRTVIHQIFAAGLELQGALRRITDAEARARVEAAIDELDRAIYDIRSAITGLTS